jgi:hypothetical protein
MKKITAFECEFCKRILKTKQAMKVHEPKCFKNPVSKSCLTCKSLTLRSCIDGNPVTDNEELILQFKVEGTYHTCTGYMEANYNELNDEFKYLENAEVENYCLAQKMRLIKLKTNCNYHAVS